MFARNDKYFRMALLLSVIAHLGIIALSKQFNPSQKSLENKIKRLEVIYSQLPIPKRTLLENKLPEKEKIALKTSPVKIEKLRGLPTRISKRHNLAPITKPVSKPEIKEKLRGLPTCISKRHNLAPITKPVSKPEIKPISKPEIKEEKNIKKFLVREETTDKDKHIAKFKDLDVKEIPFFLNYYQRIREKIRQQTIYPDLARKNLTEGTTYLSFILSRNGELKKIDIKESSGNKLLDRTAVWFIKRASPFRPFPEGLKQPRLQLSVQISYKLD